MIYTRNNAVRCSIALLLVFSWTLEPALGLSSSSSPASPKRPLVSLTGDGDVSGFLYGKLQRATSIYGSGLVGPATAIVHGDKDTTELLPPRVASQSSRGKQLKDLDGLLWRQFGMATCEGSVEREDLLTPMSYLKPRLAELKDTLVFLDATRAGMSPKKKGKASANNNQKGGVGGMDLAGGLGGMFSSFLNKKDLQQQQQQQPQQQQPPAPVEPTASDDGSSYWLDADLVRSAIPRGASIFVVCDSQDTVDCSQALAACLESLGPDGAQAIATVVSPDDTVSLGTPGDSKWSSLRPQDLEGELSQIVAVRDGTPEVFCAPETPEPTEASGGFKKTREERLAAAYAEDIPLEPVGLEDDDHYYNSKGRKTTETESTKAPSVLSRYDLAEVCVQCALRLPATTTPSPEGSRPRVRVVRVSPVVEEDNTNHGTERPNQDYFSRMGGAKAKQKAGVVQSVDWARTLSCFAAADAAGGSVREFPKRPDAT